jgi:hypothetical protein
VAVHCQCKIDVPAPGKNSGQVTVTGKIVSQNSALQRCRGDSSQTLSAGNMISLGLPPGLALLR